MAILMLHACKGSAIRTHQHRRASGRAMIVLTRTKSCPARHRSCSPLELSPSTRLTRLRSIFRRPSGRLNRLRSTCRQSHRRKARADKLRLVFLVERRDKEDCHTSGCGPRSIGQSGASRWVARATSDPARGSSGATPRPGRRSGDFDQCIVLRNDCDTFSHHSPDNRVPWVVSRRPAARTRPAT